MRPAPARGCGRGRGFGAGDAGSPGSRGVLSCGQGAPGTRGQPTRTASRGPRQLEHRRQRARSLASSGLKAPALGEACVPQQALLRG